MGVEVESYSLSPSTMVLVLGPVKIIKIKINGKE
jgi:hypothetical protein